MIRLLLVAILLLLYRLPTYSQVAGKSVSKYTTSWGTTFHRGDTLCFNRGTLKEGSFRHAYIPASALLGLPMTHYGPGYTGRRLVIRNIRNQPGDKAHPRRAVAVVFTSGNGCVDLDSAEVSREICTPRNGRPRPSARLGEGIGGSSGLLGQPEPRPQGRRESKLSSGR